MAHMDANDRAQCEALACAPGSVFGSVYRFLRGRQADRALALEALFHSVRSVSATVSDPAVAMAKLAWWANECQMPQAIKSQHPVLRAVRASAALDLLESPQWARYVGAHSRAIGATSGDLDDLVTALRDSGGQEALLLLGLGAGDEHAESAILAGMAGALLRHLENLAGAAALPTWVPDDLAAAHGLLPDQPPLDQPGVTGLVRDLADQAVGWANSPDADWVDSARKNQAGCSHLALRRVVEVRRLQRLRARPPTPGRPFRAGGGLGEVFAVWNHARRQAAGSG